MDRLEKELEQIIVMEDAGLSLRSLCRIYKETVLDDESMKDIPLEAKQSYQGLLRDSTEVRV